VAAPVPQLGANNNSTRRRGRCSLECFGGFSELFLISKFSAHSSGAGEFGVRNLIIPSNQKGK
jgi:hypothetical protein